MLLVFTHGKKINIYRDTPNGPELIEEDIIIEYPEKRMNSRVYIRDGKVISTAEVLNVIE